MNDLENIIYDALEGNAVEFQKGIVSELESRALEAIQNLRPQVAAGLFGESLEEKQGLMAKDRESHDTGGFRISDKEAKAAKERLKSRKADAKVSEEYEDVQEVAHPKSPSDKVATNIQVSKKGHPVATEAQFTAKNEKDKSKKASYHAGEDEEAYQMAQNVGIKTPKE